MAQAPAPRVLRCRSPGRTLVRLRQASSSEGSATRHDQHLPPSTMPADAAAGKGAGARQRREVVGASAQPLDGLLAVHLQVGGVMVTASPPPGQGVATGRDSVQTPHPLLRHIRASVRRRSVQRAAGLILLPAGAAAERAGSDVSPSCHGAGLGRCGGQGLSGGAVWRGATPCLAPPGAAWRRCCPIVVAWAAW